jgi:hypothetical protein
MAVQIVDKIIPENDSSNIEELSGDEGEIV